MFKATVVKQQGIGLLELMLSLAIISILIVIASRYFQSAKSAEQSVSAQTQFLEIIQAANRYKAIHGSYVGANLYSVKNWLSSTMANKVTGGDSNSAHAPAPFNETYFQLYIANASYILVRIFGFSDADTCKKVAESIPNTVCPNGNSVDFYYPSPPTT